MKNRNVTSEVMEIPKATRREKVEIYDELGFKVRVIVNPTKARRCTICHETCEIVQVIIRKQVYCYFDVPENFSFGVMASTDYLQQDNR